MYEQKFRSNNRLIYVLLLDGMFGMSEVLAESKVAIVIHGGAGTITRASMTDEKEAAIRATLKSSLQAGYRELLNDATSTAAVTAAINVMENSPLFNAGKGAVFNADGKMRWTHPSWKVRG